MGDRTVDATRFPNPTRSGGTPIADVKIALDESRDG
jgi:hypothetical protein